MRIGSLPCVPSVALWFIIISLMFFYLYKVLFSGFLHFMVILPMLKITQNTVTELHVLITESLRKTQQQVIILVFLHHANVFSN